MAKKRVKSPEPKPRTAGIRHLREELDIAHRRIAELETERAKRRRQTSELPVHISAEPVLVPIHDEGA